MEKTLLVITGPTAVGKTSLAIETAQLLGTEILSADSRQFYKEMKIGTAAPTEEELAAAPHHFIGNISIFDEYNVSRYEQEALKVLDKLFKEKNTVILTGGSGLYIDAICKGIDDLSDPHPDLRKELQEKFESEGVSVLCEELERLDPVFHKTIDKKNPVRLMRAIEICRTSGKKYSDLRNQQKAERPFKIKFLGINREREILFERIHERVDIMLQQGLISEVEKLYPMRHLNALKTVGYREFFEWKDEKVNFEQAVINLKTNTRRYAKRQLTWFRKNEQFRWFHADDSKGIKKWITTEIEQ